MLQLLPRKKKVDLRCSQGEVGFKIVAFGHHRDDNIETLLLNLLHKAEFAGNLPKVPMHDFGVTIIRPLIYASEQEIREFAKMYNFARISCQCPVGQTLQPQERSKISSTAH
jgi:tRNA 2-thiocytidine biosynthesis protein TtcA